MIVECNAIIAWVDCSLSPKGEDAYFDVKVAFEDTYDTLHLPWDERLMGKLTDVCFSGPRDITSPKDSYRMADFVGQPVVVEYANGESQPPTRLKHFLYRDIVVPLGG